MKADSMKTRIITLSVGMILLMLIPVRDAVAGIGLMPGDDMGRFSVGSGAYQAPDDAISDSGVYSFARYEIDQFEFEIDYGLTDHQFFMGTVDYLYHFPTAEGVTRAEIALGGGLTFVNDDPVLDSAKLGPNILSQIRFMDTLAVQLRYDLLGEKARLWTFGLSYSFF